MAKKTQKYSLDIDSFDREIESFLKDNYSEIEFEIVDKKSEIRYNFYKEGVKKPSSILICFISHGQTSFLSQGSQREIADSCKEHLIQKCSVLMVEVTCFTARNIDQEVVDNVKEYLKDYSETTFEDLKVTELIQERFKVIGKYGDELTFTYYKSETLLVQGRPSLVFIEFLNIVAEFIPAEEVKKEYCNFINLENKQDIIDRDLLVHVPHGKELLTSKLSRLSSIMTPSLIYLNLPRMEIVNQDCSIYAFPVLRGIEGVLKFCFIEQIGELSEEKPFGEFFRYNTAKGRVIWVDGKKDLFDTAEYQRSLLNLYRFYHEHRHALFHVDGTIASTRTLEYSEAYAIVTQGLEIIDDVFKRRNGA